MKTKYYYLRVPDDKPATWNVCSRKRAAKRLRAATETEAFYNFVVSVTETENTIIIRDIEAFEGGGIAAITLNKEFLFGGETETERAAFALASFRNLANSFQDYALRQ